MDKAKLGSKLREIHKALCTRVDEKYFDPLYEDVTNWTLWNRLHAMSVASSCDKDYVLLIEQCCRAATREFLGDIA